MRLRFAKMEGAGNDYVFVDAIHQSFPRARAPELARRWSDRHFGIGADGLILLTPSQVAAVGMAMWNADGSAGAICGNGLRCLAVFAREQGRVAADRFAIETAVGVRSVALLAPIRSAPAASRPAVATPAIAVEVELGRGNVAAEPTPLRVAGHDLECWRGEVGNPHAVVFLLTDPESFPVEEIGAAMQRHPLFPGGVNVEFVQVRSDGSLYQRTFERGSGETLACGSGAAIAALTAIRTGCVTGPVVRVGLRGGELRVRCSDGLLVIVGPARTVFVGEIELPDAP